MSRPHGRSFVTEDMEAIMKATGGVEWEKADLAVVARVLLHWRSTRSPHTER